MIPSERKTAQMIAYFLNKAEGAKMHNFMLAKLIFLADRQSSILYGLPISGVSIGYLSSDYLSSINKICNFVAQSPVDLFDELSKADTDILDSIWSECGNSREDDCFSEKTNLFKSVSAVTGNVKLFILHVNEQQYIDDFFAKQG